MSDAVDAVTKKLWCEQNPKSVLSSFIIRYTQQCIRKGDMQFETVPALDGNSYMSTLKMPTVDSKDGVDEAREFVGGVAETEKMAEQNAAQEALDYFADWIAANPPPPKEEGSKKNKKNKRKAGELGEEGDGAEKQRRSDEYNLSFHDGPERSDAASQKSLNNLPAWMTRGVGVNKELFGESQGNLVKPGLYEEDIARIEEMKRSPIEDEPDPFGDVFAERKTDPLAEVFAERKKPVTPSFPPGPLDEVFAERKKPVGPKPVGPRLALADPLGERRRPLAPRLPPLATTLPARRREPVAPSSSPPLDHQANGYAERKITPVAPSTARSARLVPTQSDRFRAKRGDSPSNQPAATPKDDGMDIWSLLA